MGGNSTPAKWHRVAAALALLAAGCSADLQPTVTGAQPPIVTTPSSTTTSTPPTTAPPPTSNPPTTNAPLPAVDIPPGGIALVPEGPYDEGEVITLLASSDQFIDHHNSWPRLCAAIDSQDEYCDPSWRPTQPVGGTPLGTAGATIELTQWHFGPDGYNDCADADVVCRLVWRTEADAFLTSEPLQFSQPASARPIALEAATTPGSVRLSVDGVRTDTTADEIFGNAGLEDIRDAVESNGSSFDLDKLDISWEIAGVCGFETGEPPIGIENLEDPPSWWRVTSTRPTIDPPEFPSFYGGSCDWDAVAGDRTLTGNDVVDLELRRNIYGFGGWVDCAVDPCYLTVIVRWLYPMTGGGLLGSDEVVERVFLEVTEDWPSVRPSISIVEPGPYETGQTVTVEVRDHHQASDGLGIGWCGGGDSFCSYRSAPIEDGVHRVRWQLPATAESCGTNRCYFEIDSAGEGLAPPAIVIVPFE